MKSGSYNAVFATLRFMTKNRTMRKTTIILATIFACQCLAAQVPADSIFTHAEVMPCFPGCESLPPGSEDRRRCSDQELVAFLSRHLVYPEKAKALSTEGTVYVSFIIDENGEVQNPTLLIDIGDDCGEAALDVVTVMPRWEPGMHRGQKVKVRLNMPIQFSLRNSDAELAERYTLTWGTLKGETVSREELLENLGSPLYVRGPEGDPRFVDQLAFTFERRKKLLNAISRGEISDTLEEVVKKVKKGGTFTITASIQDKGQFAYVTRSFQVTE